MASDLPTFAVPPGILGLGRREQDAAISIAGIPLDIGTTNRSGARFGPQAIRQASRVLIDGAHPTAWVNVSKLMLSRGTRFRPESKCQDASFDRMTAWHDIDAKVENRTTQKISRKLIFGLLCSCVAFQCHSGDQWSILDETIWSLTPPRVERLSSSKNFRSPPQKDFCNNIRQNRPFA